jgi:pyrophosphate--fructose-6-phosphate 1-phosphotransferase
MTSLREERLHALPRIPHLLKDLALVGLRKQESLAVIPTVAALFPHLQDAHLYLAEKGSAAPSTPLKVGALFSGGPAAGGHNVIAGLYDALQEMHPGSTLTGFLGGPSGFIENRSIPLTREAIASYRNQGGFDLLGTGRTKIETEEQFAACLKTAEAHDLDAFLIIGGDDSNTNAAYLAEYFLAHGLKTRVIGCPKTIDGDLTSKYIETSFGFDTAAKTYAESIGNLASDSKSQGKYYFFVKLMGRSASHLVLECALETHPNLAIISEEVMDKKSTLADVVEEIVQLIQKRAEKGLKHGVILIPEGLLEFIPECKQLLDAIAIHGDKLPEEVKPLWEMFPQDVRDQLMLDRDPHGNVQLSKVETERLLIELVQEKFKARAFNAQPLFLGYEGRSCLPSLFDAQYGYNLGRTAALLIREGKTGYMAALIGLAKPVEDWKPAAVPLASMMAFVERKGKVKAVIEKSLVDLNGGPFHQWALIRADCAHKDQYLMPGPIQFYGPAAISERITKTLEFSF